MLWIFGAIALVAAVYALSWWLVNHGNPALRFFGRHPRLRFASVVVITVAVGVFAFLVAFYPERLFGVGGGQLGSSLAGEMKRGEGACRPEGGDEWRCSVVSGSSEDSSRVFDLTYDGNACWEAVPVQGGKAPDARDAEPISACVDTFDYLVPQSRDISD